MEEKELEIAEEWLLLEKYHFKIMTIATVLADENRAYRGKLSELCEQLNIQNSSANIAKIKSSLQLLSEQDYIKLIVDHDIYTISLAKSIEKSKNIKRIKKAWYNLIRENQKKDSWVNTFKVFLILIELKNTEIYTYAEIGNKIGISKGTVSNCIKALKTIDFKDFKFDMQIQKEQIAPNEYRTQGTIFNQMISFE